MAVKKVKNKMKQAKRDTSRVVMTERKGRRKSVVFKIKARDTRKAGKPLERKTRASREEITAMRR